MSVGCGVLPCMSESAHHPEGEPALTAHEAIEHLEMLRDHLDEKGNSDAVAVANVALLMIPGMSCPHIEDPHVRCFRALLEHEFPEGGGESTE